MNKPRFIKIVLTLFVCIGVVFLGWNGLARARAFSQSGLSSGFTYQGYLESGGEPVSAACQMIFGLYDDETDAAQVAVDLAQTVEVSGGYFTTVLDFGPAAFDGQARWLEVQVQCPGDAGFTSLGRQALTPAPMALYALQVPWNGIVDMPAGFADGADDNTTYTAGTGVRIDSDRISLLFGTEPGQAAEGDHTHLGSDITSPVDAAQSAAVAQSAPWSGLSGVPEGFADGVDHDSLAELSCTSGQMTQWDGSSWVCANSYARIVVVSPVGSPAENGAALLNALASITDASEQNPYLLKIEPGVYDVAGTPVTMKAYVDIEGSGENTTKIIGTGDYSSEYAPVSMANHTELRSIKVENPGGISVATAIYCRNAYDFAKITHVTAIATGATSRTTAIFIDRGSATLIDVRAGASGAPENWGILNHGVASGTLSDVHVLASGGAAAYAVRNTNLSTLTMSNSSATASGASSTNTALFQQDRSSMLLNDVSLTASGGTSSYALNNTNGPADVQDSKLIGETYTVLNSTGVTTRIASSQLAGGPVSGGATVCAGVYDENYTFYASACP